jgi:hypothetical protein
VSIQFDGASGKEDIKEFLISPKPSVNPKWNYVYPQTTNQSQSMGFPSRILFPEDRAKRITIIRTKIKLIKLL